MRKNWNDFCGDSKLKLKEVVVEDCKEIFKFSAIFLAKFFFFYKRNKKSWSKLFAFNQCN